MSGLGCHASINGYPNFLLNIDGFVSKDAQSNQDVFGGYQFNLGLNWDFYKSDQECGFDGRYLYGGQVGFNFGVWAPGYNGSDDVAISLDTPIGLSFAKHQSLAHQISVSPLVLLGFPNDTLAVGGKLTWSSQINFFANFGFNTSLFAAHDVVNGDKTHIGVLFGFTVSGSTNPEDLKDMGMSSPF